MRGRGLGRVEVAGVQDGVVAEPGQAGGQRLVHLLGVAAGEVGPAAAVEEQVSPATSRPSTRKHWLPGVWPGVWTSSMATSPTVTTSPLAWATSSSRRHPGGAHHPRGLGRLDVDGDLDRLEQVGDALDAVAHQVAADVVGVEVGGEHARRSACRRRPGCSSSPPTS